MMNPNDIDMCLADTLRDDEMENLDSILCALNHEDGSSWRSARGESFSVEEVQDSLFRLMEAGYITPCAEQPPACECIPVPKEQVGVAIKWNALWFHLEESGREAVKRWWDTEGRTKYPPTQ